MSMLGCVFAHSEKCDGAAQEHGINTTGVENIQCMFLSIYFDLGNTKLNMRGFHVFFSTGVNF